MWEQVAASIVGALATGVLVGGAGLFRWGLAVEKRLTKLELKTGGSDG